MGVLFNRVCIALFVSLSVAIVSSQSAGSNSTVNSNTTSQLDPVNTGKKGTLQCYDCSTARIEQDCDSPSAKTPIKSCEPDENLCRKVEQHITYEGSDHVRTFRQCAKTGDLGECSERTGTHGFKSWYCQCKGNLCNSAANSFVSFTLLASMLTIFFCLKNRI